MPASRDFHTVLLKSDGTAAAFGDNEYDQCTISALPEGVTYIQAAAGGQHTVLLKSDGTAAAFGDNDFGQCNIPALPEGVIYTQAASGHMHTVVLKSDGAAIAVGDNNYGQCNIPALLASEGIRYIRSDDQRPPTILNIQFASESAAFYMLSGEEVLRVHVSAGDNLSDLRLKYMSGIAGMCRRFCAALPTGVLLDEQCVQTPSATLEPWLLRKRARISE